MKLKDNVNKIYPKATALKWGIAGCGKFAENTFIPTLLELKRNSVTAIYSSSFERAKEVANKFGAQSFYNNYNEFLKGNFDIVYIGSANSDHHWQVVEAAKAKKHIFCEKPMSMNTEQAEQMVNACKENNVLLSINYVHRFHPISVKAKEMIDQSIIGALVNISATFNIDYKPNNNFRFSIKQSGGGALRDLGTHMIDVLRFFGGEILDIKGFIDNVIYKSEVDDFATAVVKFEKGYYGYLNVSYNSKNSFNRIEITGTNGALSLENIIGARKAPGKLVIELSGEGRKAFRKRAVKQKLAIKAFQNAVLGKAPLKVSGLDGLKNMQIMEKLESQCR